MEKIALSKNTQKKLQSLVDNKDELVKKTQEELQKTYQARLNEIEKAFKSQLEAFTAALISQVVDEDSDIEFVLTKEDDEFVLKPKVEENAPVYNNSNQD